MDMNFIFSCSTRYLTHSLLTREISSWPLEDKIHIHARVCNILNILLLPACRCHWFNNLFSISFRRFFPFTSPSLSCTSRCAYSQCQTTLSEALASAHPEITIHMFEGSSVVKINCKAQIKHLGCCSQSLNKGPQECLNVIFKALLY